MLGFETEVGLVVALVDVVLFTTFVRCFRMQRETVVLDQRRRMPVGRRTR